MQTKPLIHVIGAHEASLAKKRIAIIARVERDIKAIDAELNACADARAAIAKREGPRPMASGNIALPALAWLAFTGVASLAIIALCIA